MDPQHIDLPALFKRLSLATVARLVGDYETRAAKEGWSHRDFLALLLAEEVAHRTDTRIKKKTGEAHFPYVKTIEEFDFIFQSSLRRQQLGPYLGPELVSEGRNLVLSGKPGRGKTHLAIAIAYRAIQNGFEARFVTASHLVEDLHVAAKEGRLSQATAVYVQPHVLVIDELGYLQCADDAANVLYGVINERYLRKRPILITTNKPLKRWGDVLHDVDLGETLIDRIMERGQHIRLGGISWRTRETDPAAFADEP